MHGLFRWKLLRSARNERPVPVRRCDWLLHRLHHSQNQLHPQRDPSFGCDGILPCVRLWTFLSSCQHVQSHTVTTSLIGILSIFYRTINLEFGLYLAERVDHLRTSLRKAMLQWASCCLSLPMDPLHPCLPRSATVWTWTPSVPATLPANIRWCCTDPVCCPQSLPFILNLLIYKKFVQLHIFIFVKSKMPRLQEFGADKVFSEI